jgi:hypothetical protein
MILMPFSNSSSHTSMNFAGFLGGLAAAGIIGLAFKAVEPFYEPSPVQAQSDFSYLFIEPGVTVLRTLDGRGQVQGKVVVDRRNGDVWGFPTNSSAPYPVVVTSQQPPTSAPLYLGKFDFEAIATTPKRVR